MSAETLRRAAALMRERAEAATPGPWITEHPVVVVADDDVRTILVTTGGDLPENRRNATHIASWHPAVALAVADWLDVCADVMANDPSVLKFNALLVAHAYLGDA